MVRPGVPLPAGRARAEVRAVLTALLDLTLPEECAGCGVDGPVWCAVCADGLAGAARPAAPDPAPAGLPVVWAVARYEGAVREAVVAHKERGRRGLGAPLGAALARSVAALLDTESGGRPGRSARSDILLVPAPSRASAVRDRGGDPTRALARSAATVLRHQGIGAQVAPVLRMSRVARDQAGLGAAQRAANLAGAVRVGRPLPAYLSRVVPATADVAGRWVVLVDDVVTTGATLTESTRALTDAGAVVLGAAVVAATPRRSGRTGPDG